MKKTVTLGLIQMACDESPQKNLNKAIQKIEQAAKKGAQIIALSELFLSKYFCQGKNKKYFSFAELIPGPTTDRFCEIAKKTKTSLVLSLFEKTKEKKYYNSTVVVNPNGKIAGKYRKIHIPYLPIGLYDERFYFAKGNLGMTVFKTPFAKICAPICYDQWFPEIARLAGVRGAEIIFYPTAIGWPTSQNKHLNRLENNAWQTIMRSHSIANNVFVAAINRVGQEKKLKFWGTSFVSNPYGQIIKKASSNKEEILIIKCGLSLASKMRKEWKFLDERKIYCENSV